MMMARRLPLPNNQLFLHLLLLMAFRAEIQKTTSFRDEIPRRLASHYRLYLCRSPHPLRLLRPPLRLLIIVKMRITRSTNNRSLPFIL